MDDQKKQMREAAMLYYEKRQTQSEIAKIMGLSRQTVSKLLNDAIKTRMVEFRIQDSETTCRRLEQEICKSFGIKSAIVCGVSADNDTLCLLMTVKTAARYIGSVIESGNQRIGISWGRTVGMLISELEETNIASNTVFPLFGATDIEQPYFLSNELARSFADKTGAAVKYAWFPYRPDSPEDCELFKKTSYYRKTRDLWNSIDTAIVGIGNREIIGSFGKTFGYNEKCTSVVGDISTHFFGADGRFLDIYENTMCASTEDLKNAGRTIAVASGKNKAEAIVGALRTGLVDTLITDEYTAGRVLALSGRSPRKK